MERFENRSQAGQLLAAKISELKLQNPLVIALPRGGVPVAYEIASLLQCPLDVMMTKKIGAPGNAEYAIGAVGEDGTSAYNKEAIAALKIEKSVLRKLSEQKALEIREQIKKFRGNRRPETIAGKDVIVVDDGLATGATMIVALRILRKNHPGRLIVALPVAPAESLEKLREEADEVICLMSPKNFLAVGLWYDEFDQVPDEEVIRLLEETRTASVIQEMEVPIEDDKVSLTGDLNLVANGKGLIIFAHGSGSSRHSPRNRIVAEALLRHGIATLLFDLLTREEDANPQARFDIPLLTRRLDGTLQWARREPALKALASDGLKEAAEEARRGAEGTARMRKANAGRSAYIGGPLEGVVDPGAFAVAEAFDAMAALPAAV